MSDKKDTPKDAGSSPTKATPDRIVHFKARITAENVVNGATFVFVQAGYYGVDPSETVSPVPIVYEVKRPIRGLTYSFPATMTIGDDGKFKFPEFHYVEKGQDGVDFFRVRIDDHSFIFAKSSQLISAEICTQCGKKAGGILDRCAKCRFAAYCSKECQKAHWKEGHKAECTAPNCGTPPPGLKFIAWREGKPCGGWYEY